MEFFEIFILLIACNRILSFTLTNYSQILGMPLQLGDNENVIIFQQIDSKIGQSINQIVQIPTLRYKSVNYDCEAADDRFNFEDFRCAKLINIYFLNCDNVPCLIETLNKCRQLKSWNRRALFFIFLTKMQPGNELNELLVLDSHIFSYFVILRSRNVKNDTFEINNDTEHRSTFIFSKNTNKAISQNWSIFRVSTPNCGKEIIKLSLINVTEKNLFTMGLRTLMKPMDYLPAESVFRKHCCLTLSTDPDTYTGMRYYLEDIRRFVNISFAFQKELKADALLSPVLLRPYQQSLHFIGTTQVLLYTPVVGWMEPWETVVVILSRQFWILSGFSFASLAVSWWALKKSEIGENERKTQLSEVVMNIFAVKIGLSTTWEFLGTNLKYRALFLVWIIYSMHFDVIFQGRYCKLLVDPPRKAQITSFEGVTNANLDLYVWKPFLEAVQHLTPRYTTFTYETKFLFWNRLYSDNKMAAVLGGYNFINAIFPNSTVFPPYSAALRSYMTYFHSIQIDFPQHALIEMIDKWISRLVAAGNIRKFEKLTAKLIFETIQFDTEPFPLQLKHLEVPVFAFFVGIIIAIHAFIVERKKTKRVWY